MFGRMDALAAATYSHACLLALIELHTARAHAPLLTERDPLRLHQRRARCGLQVTQTNQRQPCTLRVLRDTKKKLDERLLGAQLPYWKAGGWA